MVLAEDQRRAFKELRYKYARFCRDVRRRGIFAYGFPFMCCQSCMWADVDRYVEYKGWNKDTTENYIMFHDQSWESAKLDGRLCLNHTLKAELVEFVQNLLRRHFGDCWSWNGTGTESIFVWVPESRYEIAPI